MKSKILKKLSINFDKEITLDQPMIDKDIVEQHHTRLTELYKDLPENERVKKIDESLRDIIIKDNFFNLIMNFIVPYYEFEIDDEETNAYFEQLKKSLPTKDEKLIRTIAQKGIEKQLIFEDLKKQFNLALTENQIDESLKLTAQQVKEDFSKIKENKERYESLRTLVQDEYITSFLLNKFPLRVNLPYDYSTKQIMLFRLPKQSIGTPAFQSVKTESTTNNNESVKKDSEQKI